MLIAGGLTIEPEEYESNDGEDMPNPFFTPSDILFYKFKLLCDFFLVFEMKIVRFLRFFSETDRGTERRSELYRELARHRVIFRQFAYFIRERIHLLAQGPPYLYPEPPDPPYLYPPSGTHHPIYS